MDGLTGAQAERYGRQLLLKNLGVEGQLKLRASKALVIGTGGLGSPVAFYLAAAGVGTLGIIDSDVVDLSNLQRQILHATPDLGRDKIRSAEEKLKALNPEIEIRARKERVTAANIRGIIKGYDCVVDGTDNFPAKFLINDACVMENIPFSHGGVLRMAGQTMTIRPGSTACYRCVFRRPPPCDMAPSSAQVGILGAVAGMLGTIQAAEAIKVISGAGDPLYNALLVFDAADMDFRKVKLKRRADCEVCGSGRGAFVLRDETQP